MNLNTIHYVFIGLGVFIVLLIGYIYVESKEDLGNGSPQFSPEKCGIILKRIFSSCLPDVVLLCIASSFVSCGEIGSSCLAQINADNEMYEKKRAARVALSLSKLATKDKKKKSVKSKKNKGFETLSDQDDVEMDLADSGHEGEEIVPYSTSIPHNNSHNNNNGNVSLLTRSPNTNRNKVNGYVHSQDRIIRNETNIISPSPKFVLPQHTPPQQQQQQMPIHKEHKLPLPSITISNANNNISSSRLDLSRHSNLSNHDMNSNPSVIPGLTGRDLRELVDAQDSVLGYGGGRRTN
jgi:hypothetical protein